MASNVVKPELESLRNLGNTLLGADSESVVFRTFLLHDIDYADLKLGRNGRDSARLTVSAHENPDLLALEALAAAVANVDKRG